MTTSANDSLLILLVVLSTVLGAVLYVWTALALAGLFRKTEEQPWQGWVPVLNMAVVLRLGGFSPWLVLVGLVPIVGWIALYVLIVVAAHRIGRDFGVGPGMTVLAAFLFVVWASILGLGPASWRGQRPVVTPPPWTFAPPMSDDVDDTIAVARRTDEPVAPPTLASPVLSPHHFRPAPLASSGEDGSDADAAPAAASAEPAAPAREQAPAGLQPSPWAPPSPFAPAAESAPEAGRPSARESAPAAAPESLAATPVAPEPVVSFESAGPAEPAAPAAPAAPEPAVWAAPAAPEPAEPASAEPAPVVTPAPAASVRSVEAEADEADEPENEHTDARWPSEIDDVSALSPSPFPSRAASDRPGVVPSFADPDAAASPHAGRRTWDAVAANPIARRAFAGAPEEFPELSGEVSAVIGAPAAGAPRTAAGAVPAQLRRAEASDDHEAEVDHTVVVARRRVYWQLVLPEGETVPLTADVAIVGRQPAPDPAFPRAQLVPIDDRTRTVSKTHARLELRSGLWHITDLHSTNGVVLTNFLGTEIELEPGSDAPAGERFLLGDAELRIERPGA